MQDKNKIRHKPFDKWTWKSFCNTKKIDPYDFVENKQDYLFFVGTDSQNYNRGRNRKCIFTSAIVAYKMGTGGVSMLATEKTSVILSLRQRLLMEAMRSLECAWFLETCMPEKNPIVVHLDVNPNLKFASSNYQAELAGMVVAQGFEVVCKPDAWVASCLADRRC